MTPWRRRLRRARLAFTLGVAALVIAAAVLMALLQLALPLLARHPEKVAAFLAERVQRPVSIDAVQAQWEGAGPVLRLSGLHIAGATPEQPPLVIPQAELGVDFSAWARHNRRWNEFRLRGLDLRLERGADGVWHLAGMSGGEGGGDNPLLMLGALVVSDSRLTLADDAQGLRLVLRADELRLLNWGSEHTLLGLVRCEQPGAGPLRLVVRYDADTRAGELYAGSDQVDLGASLRGQSWQGASLQGGKGRVELWADWQEQRVTRALMRVDLAGLALRSADPALAQLTGFGAIDRLQGVARWQRSADGWSLDLAELRVQRGADRGQPSAAGLVLHRDDAGARRYELHVDQLELAVAARLAELAEPLSPALRRWLFQAAPHGSLRGVVATFGRGADFSIDGDLVDVGMESVARAPGIDRLSAHLRGDGAALVLSLPDQATVVRYPHVFRKPFAFARLGGDVAAYRSEADPSVWRIETDALAFEGEGFGGELRGAAELLPGRRPFLDLAAAVTHGEVPAAKLFWPLTSMSPRAIAWLDRALVDGRISHGRAVVRGDLADWPFRAAEGRFDAVSEIEGATLDYHRDWPRAEDIRAVAEFVNTAMHIEADAGRVLGVSASRARADIADFGDATLELDAGGAGTGAQLLGFLNASPVGKRYADGLRGVKIGGKGEVALSLRLPLGEDSGEPSLSGRVRLSDADLDDSPWKLHFDKANGEVRFTQEGFSAGPLQLGFRGHPAELRLQVGHDVADPAHALEASLQGSFPVATLFADVPELAPLWPHFPGSSPWQVALAVGEASGGKPAASQLELRSDLVGTQITLPAPLQKDAAAPLPAHLRVALPLDGALLDLALGEVLRLRARLPAAPRTLGIALAFGSEVPTQVPDEGLAISGKAGHLDVPGWIGLGSAGAGGLALRGIDLVADEARVGERVLHAQGLRVQPGSDGLQIALSGPEAQGTLRIPAGMALLQQGISADFERLYWPPAPSDEADDAPGALAGVSPAGLPPLHLRVADFRLGHASFGQATLEAAPTPQGLHFAEVVTKSPNIEMHARGDWLGSAAGNRSDFHIELTAQNLGRMLDALGYAGVVDGGETRAQIQASWPGSPTSFALARLDGTLTLAVSEGRILEVEPGMGRLLGLFSLREIPRRLALDFGDFFRTGFSFNAIKGEFALRDGSAYTSNLHIASPSADIRIDGRTGLRSKDYDQQMVVVPHVGGTLPVVGAVVGGPAGAAAGLAVQTLFNKAINTVTTARYRVTGSWDKPVITLVAREGGKPLPKTEPKPEAPPPTKPTAPTPGKEKKG